jgi:hypothetical protein
MREQAALTELTPNEQQAKGWIDHAQSLIDQVHTLAATS